MSDEKRGKGNPHFMNGLRERRRELLRRLQEVNTSEYEKIIARFAFDFDLRIEKVQEYFTLLRKAGLLDEPNE